MRNDDLNLKALLAFEKTSQTNSVSSAAKILNVSASAVSRYISILEEDIGVKLFDRRNGRMQINSTGSQFYQDVHQALETIRRSARSISRQDSDLIRIWCYPTFASEWLVPKVEAFKRKLGVRISMVTATDVPEDLMRHCDLAIIPEVNLNFVPSHQFLFEERLVPICSPSIIGPNGLGLDDIWNLPILSSHYRFKSWAEWTERYVGKRLTKIAIDFNTSSLALQAAREGLGITLASDIWVSVSLIRGTLIAPFGDKSVAGDKMYLAWENRKRSNRVVQHLAEWIYAEIQSCQAELGAIFADGCG